MKIISRKAFFYPLAIAALSRLATILFIDISAISGKLTQPDILMEYGIIARNIMKGLGFSYTWINTSGHAITFPTAYMPPGQVWIDYIMLSIFGDNGAGLIAIFMINVIFGVVSVYLIGKVVQEMFEDTRATTVALWVAALYPPFIYTSATFGVTAVVIFLNLWILLSCIRFEKAVRFQQTSARHIMTAGIGFGLLCLFRGEAPLMLIGTLLFLYFRVHPRKSLLPKLALILLIAGVVIAPWTIRNYLTLDRFVLSSSNAGVNFWRGNNAITTGDLFTENGQPMWTTGELWQKAEVYLDSGNRFDKMHSAIYFDDTKKMIEEHPQEAVILAMKKGVIFWTFDTRAKTIGMIGYIALYLTTVIFFFIGLYYVWKRKLAIFGSRLIVLWCILATFVVMIFFPSPRMQIVMVATFFPIAIYGGIRVWDQITKREQVLY